MNEAVIKVGNTKYLSRGGRFYFYDANGNRKEISQEDYKAALTGDRTASPSAPDTSPSVSTTKKAKKPVKRDLLPDMTSDYEGYFQMSKEDFNSLSPEDKGHLIHKAINHTKPSLSQAQDVLSKHGTTATLKGRGKYLVKSANEPTGKILTGPELAQLARDTVEDDAVRKTGAVKVSDGILKKVEAPKQKPTSGPAELQTARHNLDISPYDTRKYSSTKKAVRSHFEKEFVPYLPDDVEVNYSSAGTGFVSLSTMRGTTKHPKDVFANVVYTPEGTLSMDASVEDPQTGESVEIEDIPIRDPKDLDDMLDKCARGMTDKWKGKQTVTLRDYIQQESRLRKLYEAKELHKNLRRV